MEKYFLIFLNIYYWVYIVNSIVNFIYSFSDTYELNKKNKIKYGNYGETSVMNILALSLFILSIVVT